MTLLTRYTFFPVMRAHLWYWVALGEKRIGATRVAKLRGRGEGERPNRTLQSLGTSSTAPIREQSERGIPGIAGGCLFRIKSNRLRRGTRFVKLGCEAPEDLGPKG